MATPLADTYTGTPGQTIYAGLVAPAVLYPWAQNLQPNTWTELQGTAFRPWALANAPQDSYNGGDAWNACINAFCDPGYDVAGAAMYHFGGGHGDTTMNGIFKLNLPTLGWAVEFAPTPVAKYPPIYRNGGVVAARASGLPERQRFVNVFGR